VRLASQLTRYDIDILTEAEESERRQEDFRKRTGLFVEGLDVDDVIAGLLVTEGFGSIEEIVAVEDEELAGIEGFDENISAELKRRAAAFIEKRDGELDEKRRELGVEDSVQEVGNFSPAMLVQLGEKGVKTLEDLADLAGDELVEILGTDTVDEDSANAIIMAARQSAGWFGDDPAPEAGDDEPVAETGDDESAPETGDEEPAPEEASDEAPEGATKEREDGNAG
jgi:N utilization substance protein A